MIGHATVSPAWRKNRLKVLRAHRGLSQIEVAFRANLTEGRYWRLENGYREPTASEQTRIALAVRFPVWALTREAA